MLFESLEPTDQSLLLTMVLFARQEMDDLWSALPADRANLLKAEAQKVLQIERDKRIPLLVSLLKKWLSYQKEDGFAAIHPSWIQDALAREQPAMAAFLQTQLKQVEQRSEIGNEALFWFAKQFVAIEFEEVGETPKLRHLPFASLEDLEALINQLGQSYLATACSELGLKETAAWLEHFDQAIQDAVILALRTLKPVGKLGPERAQALFDALAKDFSGGIDELFARSGLFALADALHDEPDGLIRKVAQRLPIEKGRFLLVVSETSKETYHQMKQLVLAHLAK